MSLSEDEGCGNAGSHLTPLPIGIILDATDR